ncbi:uncharacterized protein LOC126834415 isoform X2 [Adelges cooleyi]|nr:uncharacterized protein LOC126834415 isoform X2 [Adelges cooleyi]
MLRFVHSDEPREIRRVLAFHGTQLANGEFIMDFEQFLRAANGGDIPKFRRQVINALYIAIIPDGSDRDYIILDDLVEYYCGERYQKTRTQMETIMNQFAEPIDGEESRLYFPNFRRILNLGFLPAPQR